LKALECLEGATPLDRDEAEGLRLTHITSREELNLCEAENIRAGMMTDLLLEKKLGAMRFTWGKDEINQANDCRQQYIQALQMADKGDYSRLLHFVRS